MFCMLNKRNNKFKKLKHRFFYGKKIVKICDIFVL